MPISTWITPCQGTEPWADPSAFPDASNFCITAKKHHWLQFGTVYGGLGQELNNQQVTNKHQQWWAAFIPPWRDITGCGEASHTILSAVWQTYLPIQCCLQYLEKLLSLAVINGNSDKEQVFHSAWGVFKKGQISSRKLLKYWHIPVFNLPWFGKGLQLHWRMNLCFTVVISEIITHVSFLTWKNTLMPDWAVPGVSFATELAPMDKRTWHL